MSSVVQPKKNHTALGRAIHRSRGRTAVQKKPVSKADRAKTAFEKLHPVVVTKFDSYKDDTSIAYLVLALKGNLKIADQNAEDENWETARDMLMSINGDLDQLPSMASDERDAEAECKTRFKQLTTLIGNYQKLDSKQQDSALLKVIDNEFKHIQKSMSDKSYAKALEEIVASDKQLKDAQKRASLENSGLVDEKAKKKMVRTAVEREEMAAANDLKVRIQAETLGEALGDPKIKALMNEHRNCLPGEVKAFKGYRWMDDVQASLDGARSKQDQKAIDDVTADIKNMAKAIQDSKGRQARMYGLLRGVKESNANKDALAEAHVFARGMLSHISDAWIVEGPGLVQRLPTMLKSGDERGKAKVEAMKISKEQRDKETALFKEVIEQGSLKGADRTQFFFDEPLRSIKRDTMDEKALGRVREAAALLKEYEADLKKELQDDDFIKRIKASLTHAAKLAKDGQAKLKTLSVNAEPDPKITLGLMESTVESENAIKELRDAIESAGVDVKTPDSRSQYERLEETFKKMILRAYAIRDAGGSVKEVESSLEHVPPEFWPPQFIENLQAWRKVERELAEERVADIFAKKDKFNFEDAKECLDLAMEVYGLLGSMSMTQGAATGENNACGWMNVPDVSCLIEGYINSVRSGFGNGKDAVNALANLDFSALTSDQLSDLGDSLAETTSTFVNAVVNLKYAGIPSESLFMVEVVPVLGAIAAGLDLGVAINALRKAITMRVKSGLMIDKAELEYFSGKMPDGGALVKAVKNERDARKRQIGMKSVDVTSKAVILSGEATKAAVGAGWGAEQAAGYGLVVAGKAIEYGGKIVFAGIDWGIADQAKKLIKEAQAGNPIARMELMENSGLYAKMYIAILAKEKHKLALEFVDQRGYDEQAVMSPAVSLKILREAMLAHADQKDETQIADNLGEALLEGVTGGGPIKAGKLIGKGAKALAVKIKDLPKDKTIPYDAKWKPKKTPVSLSTADWQTNKSDCIKNAGLYDESTGIEKALKPCDEEIKATDVALTNYQTGNSQSSGDRGNLIAMVRKTQGTIRKAMDVIVEYYPGTNDGNFHQAMADYVLDIRRVLGTHSNRLDQKLVDLKLIKADWVPPTSPGTSADEWKSNWADAAAECDLPKQDGGVGDALAAYEAAIDEVDGFKKDQLKEIRDKRVVVRNELEKAGKALKSLWSQCSSIAGALEYIDAMIGHVVKASQKNDNALNGFEWKNNPAKNFGGDPPTCFDSKVWKKTYDEADKMGFCNQKVKDCGIEAALAAWEQHPLVKNPQSVEKKDLVKNRKEVTKLLAEIAKDAEKLSAANPDSHTEFLKYIAYLRRTAHNKVAELQKAQDETFFKVMSGTDPKSWQETYRAGVDEGGIRQDDTAYKELEKVLISYGKSIAAMNTAKQAQKFKDAYSEALDAKSKAAEVQKALSEATSTEGWTNDRLNKYFNDVRNQIQNDSENGSIAEVLGGEKNTFKKQDFIFKNKGGWQETKKAAISAGLTADAKTGFGELIDSYHKAEKNRAELEKIKSKKLDVYKQSIDITSKKLKTIESAAAKMEKQTKNANYAAYFIEAGKKCRLEIDKLAKSRPA